MKVLCAFTDVHPLASRALGTYAPQADLVDVRGDPFAYWAAWRDRWNRGESFLNVEHDVEIHSSVLSTFESGCPSGYCCFPYQGSYNDLINGGLGCVWFSVEAQASHPDLLIEPCVWDRLDHRIALVFGQPHCHEPVVNHHRTYPPRQLWCACGKDHG